MLSHSELTNIVSSFDRIGSNQIWKEMVFEKGLMIELRTKMTLPFHNVPMPPEKPIASLNTHLAKLAEALLFRG